MFKKVKWTFIGIMMALLTLVLVVVLLIYNITSYNSQMDSIRNSLAYAIEAGPEGMGIPNIGPMRYFSATDGATAVTEEGTSVTATETEDGAAVQRVDYRRMVYRGPMSEQESSGEAGQPTPPDVTETAADLPEGQEETGREALQPQLGDGMGGPADFSKVDSSIPVYCVIVDTSWTVQVTSENAYMDSTLLDSALASVKADTSEFGELSELGLFYAARQDALGTRIAFADAESFHGRITENVLFSVAVGAGVLAALFVISMLLAKLAMRPVEEAWAGQQRFIADASHELKTPLTVILANTDIIQSQPTDSTIEEQSRWIDGIHEESVKMQGLVQDLLVLAQTEPDSGHLGNAPDQLVTVDFSSMVEKDILQFEAVAFESGVELEDDIAEGLSVKADADKLDRVVRVLLDNACKYVKDIEEGPDPVPYRTDSVVRVTLTGEKSSAVLKVNNGGKPIPPEDVPHVFDRFFRSDKARSDKTSGFGLGLPIAQNIVTGLGGSISAESSAEAGTTFTVKLPLA